MCVDTTHISITMSSMNRDHKQCTRSEGWAKQQREHREWAAQQRLLRIEMYNKRPKLCAACGYCIPYDSRANNFCGHSCAAKIRNVNRWHNANKERKENKCPQCGKDAAKRFCSIKCSVRFRADKIIPAWKNGSYPATTGCGQIRRPIREYLLAKHGHACSRCGWGEINPKSGRTPLQVEHIDGNSENNTEENLTVLCPNCHSLTPTYMALNRGRGRHKRMARVRAGLSY